jgi:hypothetical protein
MCFFKVNNHIKEKKSMWSEAEDVQETMQKAVEWLVSVKGNLQPGLVECCLRQAGRDRVHYKLSLKEVW